MPMVELKTYRPVCDRCGRVGSTWTNLPEDDRDKAMPNGWKWVKVEDGMIFPRRLDLVCEVCLEKARATRGYRPVVF